MGMGGAERLLVETIKLLPGHEHHLVCLSDTTSDILRKEIPSSCHFQQLGFKSKMDSLRMIRFLRRYIAKNNIQVVHSHLIMSNIFSRLATPRNIPLFNSLHNLNGNKIFGKSYGWQRITEKMTYRKKHHLIAVSKAVLDDYDHYIGIKGPSTVLYNFVGDRFFASQPKTNFSKDALRMVAVGKLKEQKNYPFLINAVRRMPAGVSLDIYGEGPLHDVLSGLIEGAGDRIKLKGSSGNLERVIPQYDLYVMSSFYEGHPIALLEAMACGMPTLVSDIPVLREATGGTGLFFSLDSEEELIGKVKEIIDGRIDLAPLAKHNLEFANKIGRKDQYLDALENLYLSKLNIKN